MNLTYKKASIEDIDFLVKTRIEVLREVDHLGPEVDMSLIEQQSYEYYSKSLSSGEHVAYLVLDGERFAGAGGVSFFRVMPTYDNPTGHKAYIMNMFTHPEYRRQGIAYHTLELLIGHAREKGIDFIALEASSMGRPLYEKMGFAGMKDEMKLVNPDAL